MTVTATSLVIYQTTQTVGVISWSQLLKFNDKAGNMPYDMEPILKQAVVLR